MYILFVGLHWWLWQAVEVRVKKPAGKGDNSHHCRSLSTGEKVQPLLHAVTAEVLSLSQKVSGKHFIKKANKINMLFRNSFGIKFILVSTVVLQLLEQRLKGKIWVMLASKNKWRSNNNLVSVCT